MLQHVTVAWSRCLMVCDVVGSIHSGSDDLLNHAIKWTTLRLHDPGARYDIKPVDLVCPDMHVKNSTLVQMLAADMLQYQLRSCVSPRHAQTTWQCMIGFRVSNVLNESPCVC